MKVLRFKGAAQEWTIPLRELSKDLRLSLQLQSKRFIRILEGIEDENFVSSAVSTNLNTLERIFKAADAKQ